MRARHTNNSRLEFAACGKRLRTQTNIMQSNKACFLFGFAFRLQYFFSMAKNNKRIQLAEWRQFKCFVSFDRKRNPFQADESTWSLVVERKPLEPKMDCLKHRKINQKKFFCLEMRVGRAKSIDFASLVQSLDWDIANNSNIGDAFKSKSLKFHVISPYHTSDSIIIYQWRPKHTLSLDWMMVFKTDANIPDVESTVHQATPKQTIHTIILIANFCAKPKKKKEKNSCVIRFEMKSLEQCYSKKTGEQI